MRRFLLMVTIISFAGWSQPAPQQAQPPIPVKIEMPPESIWIALFKVILPTLLGAGLGAGITLYGLRQTNKHNAAENRANREHQLQVEIAKAEIAAKYRSQDRRWEFRKDVYVNTIKAVAHAINAFEEVAKETANCKRLEQVSPVNSARAERTVKRLNQHLQQMRVSGLDFAAYSNLAPLAVADSVLPLISAFETTRPTSNTDSLESIATWTTEWTTAYNDLLKKLQEAGRNDLWGTPEPEAKAVTKP